ncbi:MAG: LytTR family transcriptional regulator [Bacteroidales bacterium]|jgi:two-component system LytT family response regulator|nr:LytTR family transcriptional regulator [Bacteroidales bacterium]
MDPFDGRIIISETKGFKQVEVASLSHIICEDYLCTLYITNEESVTCGKSLRYFEQVLQPYPFVRIHHNAIVNLSQVAKVHFNGRQRHVVMHDGTALPISVRKWPRFRDIFRSHTLATKNDTLTAESGTPTRKTNTHQNQGYGLL